MWHLFESLFSRWTYTFISLYIHEDKERMNDCQTDIKSCHSFHAILKVDRWALTLHMHFIIIIAHWVNLDSSRHEYRVFFQMTRDLFLIWWQKHLKAHATSFDYLIIITASEDDKEVDLCFKHQMISLNEVCKELLMSFVEKGKVLDVFINWICFALRIPVHHLSPSS